MPFQRPDLVKIEKAIAADIDRLLPGAEARARHSVLAALSRAEAGAVHGLYGYLDHLSKQVFPDTAETEHLERWAAVWGINRKAATVATGQAVLTGADDVVIPAGTLLQTKTELAFMTKGEAVIKDGQALVDLEAQTAGTAGNLSVESPRGGAPPTGLPRGNMVLNLVSPIADVQASATVTARGITGGVDAETDDALRERLLGRIRRPPQGGARHDYEDWTLAQPGVTRAWVYPGEVGIGTITIRFMMDDLYHDGIPRAEDVARVQAALDLLRPVTAEVIVAAPIPVPLNITGLTIAPDTVPVRSAIEAEVTDLIKREAVPGGTILISHIREAISLAVGETDHVLSAPSQNITCQTGEILIAGRFPWTPEEESNESG